jgi:Na+-translocating ferredoxin:NAD+ oxidoreductase RnfG subunit
MSDYSNQRRQILRRTALWGLGATSWMGSGVMAAVFLDIEQVQKIFLPEADRYLPVPITLDESKRSAIASQSETRLPRQFSPQVWQGQSAGKPMGWIMSDRVIGKYDWIDYAVGFSAEGTVLGVEILAYRESHGAEIRQSAWRKQFQGRQGPQSMRFADDIRHISGATMSCQHVTEGVQRLSALVGLLKGIR